jgi:hypothetical protein
MIYYLRVKTCRSLQKNTSFINKYDYLALPDHVTHTIKPGSIDKEGI